METMGGANSDTGWLEPTVNAVDTKIAFDHLSGFRVPLGGPPGTRRYARFAADAERPVYKDNAILCSLLHGPGWTSGHTPGIFAVKAGHKRICGPRQVTDEDRPHGHNLAQSGTHRQVLVALADHFAAAAPDTFFGVLKQVVIAHAFSLY